MSPTRTGVILGTAAYMSPEQTRGGVVDKRADIWAFGVVLYEMLTGRLLFQGETISDTLAAVLKTDPDWNALPADTPAPIRRLLRRCLQRDRKRRLHDIGDALIEIDEAQAEPQVSATPSAVSASRPWPWTVAGVLAILLLATVVLLRRGPPPVAHPLMRLSVELGPDVQLARSSPYGGLAISPDGTRLAIRVYGADGQVRLGTRQLDRSEVTTIPGTEGASFPFFSPDGQWIAFFAPGKLKKVAAQGGAPVTLCDALSQLGGNWGDDGNIVAALGLTHGLLRIPSTGGAPTPMTKLTQENGELRHSWPQVLPGSQAVLFTAYTVAGGLQEPNIEVLSFKTGERKILHRGFFGRYLPSGHLVYVHQNMLFAAPFDLKGLALTGTPQPVLEDVSESLDVGGDFDFSRTGTLVYLSRKGELQRSIFWLDSAGATKPLHPAPGIYSQPHFSPDGRRLAFEMDDGQGRRDVWVQDLERDTTSRLTFQAGGSRGQVWSADGRNIFYSSSNPAAPGEYSIRADGSGEARLLMEAKIRMYASSVSPDGKHLAMIQPFLGGGVDIWTTPVEGDRDRPRLGKPEAFLQSQFIKIQPVFSPDSRWLAYSSNESGTREIFVRPFPGPGGGWQISTGGGMFPMWSRNGRELFFRAQDHRIMTVAYTANGSSFVAGKPRVWSEKRILDLGSPPIPTFDLAPDGKRFAVVLYPDGTAEQKPITHLTFVLNFFDELRRRVPADSK